MCYVSMKSAPKWFYYGLLIAIPVMGTDNNEQMNLSAPKSADINWTLSQARTVILNSCKVYYPGPTSSPGQPNPIGILLLLQNINWSRETKFRTLPTSKLGTTMHFQI